jgi:phosphoglycolate phosphatase
VNKLIIWDWNGTLLNDMDACIQALNFLLEKRNMQAIDLEMYRNAFGFPVIDYYKTVGFDLERESFDSLAVEFIDHYNNTVKTAGLQEGAVEMLSRLKSQGCRQIVLSATESTALRKQIGDRGILHYFDEVLGSDNIHAHGKISVARNYFQKIEKPSQSVMIGDTFHDYEVAAAIECPCVLLKNGHQNLNRFCFNRAIHIANSLPELAQNGFLYSETL